MPEHTRQVAVLLFTRSPEEEAKHKAFAGAGNHALNIRIAESLIGHAESIIKKSGLPHVTVHSSLQQGSTFGEKFAHAIEHVFSLGYEQVITIGNDCLQLHQTDLQQAAQALEQSKVVFGPAKDGGLYLIGMHRSVFHAHTFSTLHWDTPFVMEEMLECFSLEQHETTTFAELEDADSGVQLQKLLHSFYSDLTLRSYLLSLFASVDTWLRNSVEIITCSFQMSSKSLRAPPLW